MLREDDHGPDVVIHHILRALPCKKAAQPTDADILDDVLSVHTSARKGDRIRIQIRGKNLHVPAKVQLLHDLGKQNRNRVRLLAGGTARHPHTDLIGFLSVLHDILDHPLLQHLEELRVTEKRRHADQDLFGKRFCLLLVLLQILNIALKIPTVRYHHPPLDPAKDRRLLVIGVVRIRDALEDRKHLRHQIPIRQLHLPVGQINRGRNMRHFLRDRIRSQNQIHKSCRDGVSRHTVKFRRLRVLHDNQAVLLLDRTNAVRTVRTRPRQDHRDRTVLIRDCQRTEENVDRMIDQRMVVLLQVQNIRGDLDIIFRRQKVNVVPFYLHAIPGFLYRECGILAQNLHEQTLVIRRQMLNDDKSHTGILRKECQKLLKRLQATRRGSDAYHTARLDLHWNFHIIYIHAHLPQTARNKNFSRQSSASDTAEYFVFILHHFPINVSTFHSNLSKTLNVHPPTIYGKDFTVLLPFANWL